MTHPTDMLSALLDGELDAADRARVEAHVAQCAECADHLRELTALDGFARGLGSVAAPAGYHETLAARLRPRLRGDRAPSARRVPAWAWPLAAGLAIAVVAPIVLRQQAPVTSVAPPAAPVPPLEAMKDKVAPPQAAAPAMAEEKIPAENRAARSEKQAFADGRSYDRVPATPAAPARQAPVPSKTVDAFAAPPPAVVQEQEADLASREDGGAGSAVGGTAAAAPEPPAGDERKNDGARVAGALARRADAPSPSLKKEKTSAEDARRARESWRRIAEAHPDAEGADAARVRVIEAGLEAYRLGGDEADRVQAQRDAEAYLSRADAAQAARVRTLARRLRESAPR